MKQPVDSAIQAWKQAESRIPGEKLSAGTRVTILAHARSGQEAADEARGTLASLFLPASRIIATAAAPALVLALGLAWMLGGAAPTTPDSVRVEVSKVGGEAVFRIANGGKMHRIYRLDELQANPQHAKEELFTTTDSAFSDRLSGTNGVTYYRID